MGHASRVRGTKVPAKEVLAKRAIVGRQYLNTSRVTSLYHCWTLFQKRFYPCTMHQIRRRGSHMEAGYNAWLGQAVVLQVALGDIKVPLRGRLLKEGGETVRMRVGDGWDIDIYKAMILTVEKDGMALIPA